MPGDRDTQEGAEVKDYKGILRLLGIINVIVLVLWMNIYVTAHQIVYLKVPKLLYVNYILIKWKKKYPS